MSVATEISRLQTAKADLKTAIEAQGVTVPSSTTLDGYAALVGQISGGSTDEISYPAWLKDGDTHLWIEITASDQLAQAVRITMKGTIDWGDGSTTTVNSTSATTYTHTYTTVGKYRIDLKPTSGTFKLGGNSTSYSVMGAISARRRMFQTLYQVEVGTSQITELTGYCFYWCPNLLRVYVPKNVVTIGASAFRVCVSLAKIEFEDETKLTSVSGSNTFYQCYNLLEVPQNVPGATSLSTIYYYCNCIDHITIPSTVTSIAASSMAYMYCLKKMTCLPSTPPTVANANAFTSLPAACVIEVPSASLATYQAANIWADHASQMVGV